MAEHGDAPEEMSPRERARVRHRERKRTTTMVVDNAAVRRTVQALARRTARPGQPPDRPGEAHR